jgi:hypothetical protein
VVLDGTDKQKKKKKFPHTNCYFFLLSQTVTKNTKNKVIAVFQFRTECISIFSWSFNCAACAGACDR